METASAGRTVFVVDDDEDVLLSLKFFLEGEGYRVHTFLSGSELQRAAALHAADCMIIDYKMPVMDGLELVGWLRNARVRAPVVLITGFPNDGIEAKAAAHGVKHVVLKPHIDESLLTHLTAAIDERGADLR